MERDVLYPVCPFSPTRVWTFWGRCWEILQSFIRTPPPPYCRRGSSEGDGGGGGGGSPAVTSAASSPTSAPSTHRPSNVARRRGGQNGRSVGSAHCAGVGGDRAPPPPSRLPNTPTHPHAVASLISDYDGGVFNSGRTISQPRGRRIIVFSE